MRPAFLLAATLTSAALAETAPPTERLRAEDRATVIRLNRAAARGRLAAPARADGNYARALADYRAARARNDSDRATAADAAEDYARAQAAYRADMARWREEVAAGAYPR